MKIQKILFALALIVFIAVGCKNDAKKDETKQEVAEAKAETVSLNISGMTCEIGCAKTIQSKLAKKEGVLDAKVVFADSIATIKYDANKTNKADLIAFVEGVGSGDMYKAAEATTAKKECNPAECEKKCTDKKDASACKADCKMECCVKKAEEKTACADDCKMACCTAKKA
ncbi:cation transporter [Tenacibaculum sp. IB213877]|uniref:cation transporter n=1 Tax=Tenacibaculum sp. IB213877 TaxID=3097351 RepID=UPI002A5993B4|nr:cation transporter [Tenacibaculum sp. IB213877]MDY0780361.1 cation transporter [Tenacibaculum sp. IB213877]